MLDAVKFRTDVRCQCVKLSATASKLFLERAHTRPNAKLVSDKSKEDEHEDDTAHATSWVDSGRPNGKRGTCKRTRAMETLLVRRPKTFHRIHHREARSEEAVRLSL